jgi:sugar O-acyltransferase (sialic acid O-acetyltransferase NeuD family)
MVILYGASGHGKVVAEILSSRGVRDLVFYDDNPKANLFNERISPLDLTSSENHVIVTVGLNHIRRDIVKRNPNLKYSRAIHISTNISPSVEILEGSVVMAGAIINVDSKIGKHVIVNTGAVVDHDCEILDFSHISPNATVCGGVKIGEGSWIGAGATIKNGLTIGEWVIVGAGAVVIEDIPDNSVVVGNPSRFLKKNEKFK